MVTLLTAPGVEYRDPCWSPDGEHLLVSTNRATGHNFELWLVDADGSNAQQVTTYEGNVRRPVWQPRRLITMNDDSALATRLPVCHNTNNDEKNGQLPPIASPRHW